MSSSNSPALVLELPYSWRRLIPAGSLLLSALLLPWLVSAWSPALRGGVMLAGLGLATAAAWQVGAIQPARRLIRVAWGQSGEWRLNFAEGEPVGARLSAGSWWSPWLMCWRFVDEAGRRHGLLLWRSGSAAGSWHSWQLRLRLEATHVALASSAGLSR